MARQSEMQGTSLWWGKNPIPTLTPTPSSVAVKETRNKIPLMPLTNINNVIDMN
jgi:hypothetical protein